MLKIEVFFYFQKNFVNIQKKRTFVRHFKLTHNVRKNKRTFTARTR